MRRRTARGSPSRVCQERKAVRLGVHEDVLGRRRVRKRERPWSVQLCGGYRYRWTGRILAVSVVVAADQAGRAEGGERQFVVEELVLGHVLQQERDPAGGDEGTGGVGCDRDLAVAALRLPTAPDDCELPFGARTLRRLAKRHMGANALVVAQVVELDAYA